MNQHYQFGKKTSNGGWGIYAKEEGGGSMVSRKM